MKPSGKTQARKKHRVRIRQTRSSLLRQTFADKKSGQSRQESEETFQTESRKRISRLSLDKLQLIRSNKHCGKKHKVPIQAGKG